jgi:hypothetical protein
MVEEALSLITGRSGGAAVGIACQRANPLILAAAYPHAALAQLVEHIIRNDGVTGSSPVSGTSPSEALAPEVGFSALECA